MQVIHIQHIYNGVTITKPPQGRIPQVTWLLINFSTLYRIGGFITIGIQVLGDVMLRCWVSSSQRVEGKYRLHRQDEEILPCITPLHNMFWLIVVLMKATGSLQCHQPLTQQYSIISKNLTTVKPHIPFIITFKTVCS